MLSILLEMLIALLAAVGTVSLSCLLFSRWFFPLAETQEEVLTLVPAKQDGCSLDQTVCCLLRLRRWGLLRGRVAVVDCGLDEEGRTLARLLCSNSDEVLLCDPRELSKLMT